MHINLMFKKFTKILICIFLTISMFTDVYVYKYIYWLFFSISPSSWAVVLVAIHVIARLVEHNRINIPLGYINPVIPRHLWATCSRAFRHGHHHVFLSTSILYMCIHDHQRFSRYLDNNYRAYCHSTIHKLCH